MKEFTNILELLNDKQTRKYIVEEIQLLFDKKDAVLEKVIEEAGGDETIVPELKNSVVDNLQSKGLLQLPEIGYAYIGVRNKHSFLSARERAVVEYIVKKACHRALKYYNLINLPQ